MIELTEIEINILKQKADGKLDKQIASGNNKSYITVKNQLSSIYQKLGALNAPNAVYIAMKRGIIQ